MPTDLDRAAELRKRKFTTEEVHRDLDLHQLTDVPHIHWDEDLLSDCHKLYTDLVLTANGTQIDENALTVQKWVFLEFLTFHVGLLTHGSNDVNIPAFELRAAKDNLLDGDTPRIYASQSALVSTFYAILNRPVLKALPNVLAGMGVYHVPDRSEDGIQRDKYYFAIDYRALPHNPWRSGMIYLFDRHTYQPDYANTQWFTTQLAQPLARIAVHPSNWPLHDQVRGQNLLAFHGRFNQNRTGWPWFGDETLYPKV